MSSRYWFPLPLVICFITSLLLRIIPPFHQIFTPLGIKFAMNDAYYHMRLVDNLVANFPHFSYYDPYFIFPGTTVIGGTHFFDWMLATIAWVMGLGHPVQATVNMVGVYTPPILAALLVIPVYFIGKSIFNKWVGIIGALLIAILPGELLGRSILGATDHHVAEVLFSTVAMMFFVLAIRSASTKWTRVFTVLAGLFLGIYLLTWLGGLLFVGIISLFAVTQTRINHLRGTSSFRIAGITTAVIGIAMFMNISSTLPKEILLALGLATILPLGLATVSWGVTRKLHWPSVIFLPVTAVAGILSLVLVNWIYPPFLDYLGMLLPSGSTATTTLELQPILFPHGQFTLEVLWRNFTTTAILAPVALVILSVLIIRDKGRDEGKLLLVIWSVVMIALMLNQRRYAYYVAVNMALLSGYLVYLATTQFAEVRKKHKGKWTTRLSLTRIWLAVPVIVSLLIPLNLSTSIQTARSATFAPPDAWQSATLWMKDNTPEPFQDGDIYYDYLPLMRKDMPKGQRQRYSPVPNYTVSAWWDYGYWITRIGHRVPNANPAQNASAIERIANLLLSTKDDYKEQVDSLRSRYIVIDKAITMNKFYALVSWDSKETSDYFMVYRVPHDTDGYRNLILFYPAYYETLISRLYYFDGKEVAPDRTVVITHKDNIVLDAREFKDWRKAQEYVEQHPNTRMISANPRASPIPLEKMDYELVYNNSEVKIFEYTGTGEKN